MRSVLKIIAFVFVFNGIEHLYSQKVNDDVELKIINKELYFGSKKLRGNYNNEIVFFIKNHSHRSQILFIDESKFTFADDQNSKIPFCFQAEIKDSLGYSLIPEEILYQSSPDVVSGVDRFGHDVNKVLSKYVLRNIRKGQSWFFDRSRIEEACIILKPNEHIYIFLNLTLPIVKKDYINSFDPDDNSNTKNSLLPGGKYTISFNIISNSKEVLEYLSKAERKALKREKIEFYEGILNSSPIPLMYREGNM